VLAYSPFAAYSMKTQILTDPNGSCMEEHYHLYSRYKIWQPTDLRQHLKLTNCRETPGLCHNDIDPAPSPFFYCILQNELRHLCGLATPGVPSYNQHLVARMETCLVVSVPIFVGPLISCWECVMLDPLMH
jgi:hypothetical protein